MSLSISGMRARNPGRVTSSENSAHAARRSASGGRVARLTCAFACARAALSNEPARHLRDREHEHEVEEELERGDTLLALDGGPLQILVQDPDDRYHWLLQPTRDVRGGSAGRRLLTAHRERRRPLRAST